MSIKSQKNSYFVYIKVANNFVKTGIQIIEEVDHLKNNKHNWLKSINFQSVFINFYDFCISAQPMFAVNLKYTRVNSIFKN